MNLCLRSPGFNAISDENAENKKPNENKSDVLGNSCFIRYQEYNKLSKGAKETSDKVEATRNEKLQDEKLQTQSLKNNNNSLAEIIIIRSQEFNKLPTEAQQDSDKSGHILSNKNQVENPESSARIAENESKPIEIDTEEEDNSRSFFSDGISIIRSQEFNGLPKEERPFFDKSGHALFNKNQIESSESSEVSAAIDYRDGVILNLIPPNLSMENVADQVDDLLRNYSFMSHQKEFEYYDSVVKEGKITFSIPCGEKKRLIYGLFNSLKGCWLVGQTHDLKRRFQNYSSSFNNKQSTPKQPGKIALFQDIKKNPKDFKVVILHKLADDEQLFEEEKKWIERVRKVCAIYNDNEGGGGGLSHSEQSNQVSWAISRDAPLTPTKRYPVTFDENGVPKILFSPGIQRQIDASGLPSHVYTYKNISPETNHSGQHYVGASNEPQRRAREHLWGRRSKVSRAIRNSRGRWSFGVIPFVNGNKLTKRQRQNHHIFKTQAAAERFMIARKRAFKNGFNQTRGGEGPIGASVANQ